MCAVCVKLTIKGFAMHQFMKLTAFLALAACGGSSGGSDPVLSEIELLRIEAGRLSQEVSALELTAPDFTPPVGDYEYSGIATFGFLTESSQGDGVGGDMSLSVDFVGSDASGQIDNFISRDGDAREGLLIVNNGQLIRTPQGIAMTADVSGTLDILSGVKQLDGDLVGGFVGDDADYIRGSITTSFPLQLAGDGGIVDVSVDGAFIVEQQ